MADTNCIRRDCVVCDSPLSGLQKLYCGRRCNLNAWVEANPDKHEQHRRNASPPKSFVAFKTCADCEQTFTARTSVAIWCRSCNMRRACAKELVRNERTHREAARVTECAECGAAYCPLYGASNTTLCVVCARERARRYRRAQKSQRDARKRGLHSELVDPLRVFDRDRWICQLCGVKTTKRLRGTCSPMAPELDHIIPLSLGGPHTYLNTQCACRKCNGEKSNRPLGQLLLVG